MRSSPDHRSGSGPPAHPRVATIGVLALQGDFHAHARVISELGAEPRLVKTPEHLEGLDGLIVPGGESTTMTLGIEREGLGQPLRDVIGAGTPTLGTCAGLIMLDRDHLGLLDLTTERNAFGRQVRSFETDLKLTGFAESIHAVFIRAPWVGEHGDGVEVLAEVDGHPVAVRQGQILAVAFHPELDGEKRLHEWLLAQVQETSNGGGRT